MPQNKKTEPSIEDVTRKQAALFWDAFYKMCRFDAEHRLLMRANGFEPLRGRDDAESKD